MRVPAIGFDPPLGSPTGVTPLAAALAASRTSVSPEGRRAQGSRHRERRPAEPAEPGQQPADDVPAQRAPLPVAYPPLAAQRAVLDRPPPAPPVEEDLVLPVAWPGPLAPDADSALEQHLRRVMGSLRRED